MGEDLEVENESFGYVAGEVYEELTGEDLPPMETEADDEEDSPGEDWDFDDRAECEKRIPRLTKLYWSE